MYSSPAESAEQSEHLQQNFLRTYWALRRGLAVMGFGFPVVLSVGGAIQGLELQGSMSAYYHAHPATAVAPMRDVFVGLLFAVGICLFVYQGYTARENWALNLAGIFAAGIALFPMEWPATTQFTVQSLFKPHYLFAFGFFACIAFVCLTQASATLTLIQNDPARQQRFRKTYFWIGIAMISTPVIAWFVHGIFGLQNQFTFVLEAVGIQVFALYWAVKSYELEQTYGEHLQKQKDFFHRTAHRLSRMVKTRLE